jgi:uncharacterized protein DUF3592
VSIPIGLGVIPFAFGTLLLGDQGLAVVRGLRSQQWDHVVGRILTSVVWKDLYAGDRHVFWAPAVEYEYEVRGQRYTGRRISFAQGLSGSFSRAARLARSELRAGREVRVWYHPTRPERAVLVPGVSLGSWLVLGFGAVLVAMGWVALG